MFEIDSFYLIILSVAVFILILALGFTGWMLSKQNDQIDFPNITATCPDFWTIDATENCVQPTVGNFNYGKDANIITSGYVKLHYQFILSQTRRLGLGQRGHMQQTQMGNR